jgi:ribonuclease BN (tRNA processing enzyme)
MGFMELTVVGCAGSFPSAGSAASCYLVEAEGFRLVIDLGNGALGALQRYARLEDIDAICLSHLHGDHCVDLGAYAVARQYRPGGPLPALPVYAPLGAAEQLGPVFGSVAEELAERFTFRDLEPGRLELGPLTVTTARMNHLVETFGFRVEYDGWVFAYSADTGESAELVGLADGADLLLCEASFLDEPGNPAGVHLSGRQAGEHAAKAGAGELVLTHLVAWHDPEVLLGEAAAVYGGPVSAAAPGRKFGPACLQPEAADAPVSGADAGDIPVGRDARHRRHRRCRKHANGANGHAWPPEMSSTSLPVGAIGTLGRARGHRPGRRPVGWAACRDLMEDLYPTCAR